MNLLPYRRFQDNDEYDLLSTTVSAWITAFWAINSLNLVELNEFNPNCRTLLQNIEAAIWSNQSLNSTTGSERKVSSALSLQISPTSTSKLKPNENLGFTSWWSDDRRWSFLSLARRPARSRFDDEDAESGGLVLGILIREKWLLKGMWAARDFITEKGGPDRWVSCWKKGPLPAHPCQASSAISGEEGVEQRSEFWSEF